MPQAGNEDNNEDKTDQDFQVRRIASLLMQYTTSQGIGTLLKRDIDMALIEDEDTKDQIRVLMQNFVEFLLQNGYDFNELIDAGFDSLYEMSQDEEFIQEIQEALNENMENPRQKSEQESEQQKDDNTDLNMEDEDINEDSFSRFVDQFVQGNDAFRRSVFKSWMNGMFRR